MAIRRYVVSGVLGGSHSYETDLCDYHASVKKVFAREMSPTDAVLAPDAKCEDCRPATGPYVLDRVIAESDAKEGASDPVPVKVLPGQGRLFK